MSLDKSSISNVVASQHQMDDCAPEIPVRLLSVLESRLFLQVPLPFSKFG